MSQHDDRFFADLPDSAKLRVVTETLRTTQAALGQVHATLESVERILTGTLQHLNALLAPAATAPHEPLTPDLLAAWDAYTRNCRMLRGGERR